MAEHMTKDPKTCHEQHTVWERKRACLNESNVTIYSTRPASSAFEALRIFAASIVRIRCRRRRTDSLLACCTLPELILRCRNNDCKKLLHANVHGSWASDASTEGRPVHDMAVRASSMQTHSRFGCIHCSGRTPFCCLLLP